MTYVGSTSRRGDDHRTLAELSFQVLLFFQWYGSRLSFMFSHGHCSLFNCGFHVHLVLYGNPFGCQHWNQLQARGIWLWKVASYYFRNPDSEHEVFDTKTLGPWIWITLLKSSCEGDIEILVSRFDMWFLTYGHSGMQTGDFLDVAIYNWT